jgi:hypothetical protein
VRRTFVVIAGLSLAGATLAGAQIIDSGTRGIGGRGPIAFTSLSIGWMQQQSVCDQDSGACWDFGSAPQWRGTLEFPMGRGAAIGVAATTARVPLIYRGGLLGPNDCSGCDADANITQYFAKLHLGGGTRGFQQVIDINAGMTVFSNFRTASGGTRLGPGKANSDASFSVGYGFGYGFTERMMVMLVQEYGLVIHERQSGSSNNTAQQTVTRVGLRYGMGDK